MPCIPADGTLTLYAHDDWSRLTQVTYGVSPMTSQQDAPIKYSYGSLGIDVTECTTGQSVQVSWGEQNADQRVAKVEDHAGIRQYAYDPLGRVVLVTEQRNGETCARVTRTQFDSVGRVAALQYPTGRLIEYVYNGAEPTAPSSVWTHIDGAPIELVSNVRTAGGRVTGFHSWNGVENEADAYLTGQPLLKLATLDGTSVSYRLVMGEDAQGNPLHIDGLTPATTEHLTYDPAFQTLMTAQSDDPTSPAPYRDIQYTVARGLEGNRLKVKQLMPSTSAADMCVAQTVESLRTSTYEYFPESSQLKTLHVEQTDSETGHITEMTNFFVYTKSGAMTLWTVYNDRDEHYNFVKAEWEVGPAKVHEVDAEYDQEDQMVAWTDETAAYQYEYDSRHLRSRKLLPGGEKTQFWYAGGGQLLAEQHQPAGGSEPATIRDYVWLGGTVAAFIDSEVTSGGMEDDSVAEAYFVHSGLLSEAQAVTDASGFVVWRGEREPFGTINSEAVSSLTGGYALGLPGMYSDAETGMMYNWHRYYNSAVGRYSGADPLLTAGGEFPPYGYANGNPLVFVDPTGLKVLQIFTGDAGPAAQAALDQALQDPQVAAQYAALDADSSTLYVFDNDNVVNAQAGPDADMPDWYQSGVSGPIFSAPGQYEVQISPDTVDAMNEFRHEHGYYDSDELTDAKWAHEISHAYEYMKNDHSVPQGAADEAKAHRRERGYEKRKAKREKPRKGKCNAH